MLDHFANDDRPVLVIGRAGMDLYPDPPGSRTEDATAFFSALGGSSANIAVALSRFDVKAELITCVSDDAVGRYAVNQLRRYGVACDKVRSVRQDTRTSLAVVESRTEDHQSVIYRNNAADFAMDQSDLEAIDFRQFSALVVTGTCLTKDPSRTATLYALKAAQNLGLPTIMDLDYRPYSWENASHAQQVYNQAVDLLDIVVGNDDEFGYMAGDYQKGQDYARELSVRGKHAIYKRGELGSCIYCPDGRSIETGVFTVQPLKPTGAGDSFLGGFLASLRRHSSLEEALLDGSACAAMVVTRVGCAPAMPDLAELTNFRKTHRAQQRVIGE